MPVVEFQRRVIYDNRSIARCLRSVWTRFCISKLTWALHSKFRQTYTLILDRSRGKEFKDNLGGEGGHCPAISIRGSLKNNGQAATWQTRQEFNMRGKLPGSTRGCPALDLPPTPHFMLHKIPYIVDINTVWLGCKHPVEPPVWFMASQCCICSQSTIVTGIRLRLFFCLSASIWTLCFRLVQWLVILSITVLALSSPKDWNVYSRIFRLAFIEMPTSAVPLCAWQTIQKTCLQVVTQHCQDMVAMTGAPSLSPSPRSPASAQYRCDVQSEALRCPYCSHSSKRRHNIQRHFLLKRECAMLPTRFFGP